MSGKILSLDKSRCKHTTPRYREGQFLHSNDANENAVVTFFFVILANYECKTLILKKSRAYRAQAR